MVVAQNWEEYELIDAGEGEKLERWGEYILRRPDPQAIWTKNPSCQKDWESAASIYNRSSTGGGSWDVRQPLPEKWQIAYKNLKLWVKPTGFKHTGVFPEQAPNWDFLMDIITRHKASREEPIQVLNLFAYTGGATVACAYAGAEVCHLDSSKQILSTAKENIALSGLSDRFVRFIPEDAISFVKKEIRRGNKYDIIIMDPPTFGRGDKGQVWKIEKDLSYLVELCAQVVSDQPVAIIINAYVSNVADYALRNLLSINFAEKFGGKLECDSLGLGISRLRPSKDKLILPAGIYARWSKD